MTRSEGKECSLNIFGSLTGWIVSDIFKQTSDTWMAIVNL